MRKDRGFRGPQTGAPSGKGKGTGKNKTGVCFVCNQRGHWKGDPECPGAPVQASCNLP